MKKLMLDSEQMSNLTEEEIKLINFLGIALEEKNHTKSTAKIAKEYDLVITKHCKLCGGSEARLYHMTQDLENRCLVAVQVEAVSDKYKTKTYVVSCCKNCRKYLLTKQVDEVIDLFIEELNRRFFI